VQLTGEVGAGKTTLCRAMLEQLGEGFATALIFNPVLDADQLMKAIAMEFGLDVNGLDRLETVAAINAFLLQQVEQQKDAVLIIDEAQDLTNDLLEQVRLLSNLETADRKLLQIVLMGQPELRDRLNDFRLRQLRQRITVRYHLRPLTRSELGQYVHHRLRVSGAKGAPYFFDDSTLADLSLQPGDTAIGQRRLRQMFVGRVCATARPHRLPHCRTRHSRVGRKDLRMSLVNDALKRARQLHKKPAAPTDSEAPLQPVELKQSPPAPRRASVVIVPLCVAVLGLAGWFLWQWGNSTRPTTQVASAPRATTTNRLVAAVRTATNVAALVQQSRSETNAVATNAPEPTKPAAVVSASTTETNKATEPTPVVAANSPAEQPQSASTHAAGLDVGTNLTAIATGLKNINFPALRLQGIYYGLSKPSVLINNKTLHLNDQIEGSESRRLTGTASKSKRRTDKRIMAEIRMAAAGQRVSPVLLLVCANAGQARRLSYNHGNRARKRA